MDSTPSRPANDAPPRRERLITLPLAVFLLFVGSVLAFGLWQRWRVPGPDEAITLLADGDLDGIERRRLLRITVDASLQSDDVAHRWAGFLAAVSLDDHAALAVLRARLGGGDVPKPLPAADRIEFLDLGDPLLRNVLRALLAEAGGDRATALVRWRQVAAQCQLMEQPLAAELARAGIQRCS